MMRFRINLRGAKPPSFRNSAGFTLIELVAVMVLISILAAFIVPRMTGTSGLDEFIVRDQLISAIRFAQQRAMYDQADGHCYRIVTTATDIVVQRSIDSGGIFSALDTGPGDINFREGDATVRAALQKLTLTSITQRFDGMGSPVNAGTGTSPPCLGSNSGTQIFRIGGGATPLCINLYSTGYVHAAACPP